MAKQQMPNYMQLYEAEVKRSAEFAAMAEGLRIKLRDKMAMAAVPCIRGATYPEQVARTAYEIADAMLDRRESNI